MRQCQLADMTPSGIVAGDPFDWREQVEQADLDLVLLHWGDDASMAPPTWINHLPTGNVDQDELDLVLLNWGKSLGQGLVSSASVPEPGSTAILCVCVAVVVFWRLRIHNS